MYAKADYKRIVKQNGRSKYASTVYCIRKPRHYGGVFIQKNIGAIVSPDIYLLNLNAFTRSNLTVCTEKFAQAGILGYIRHAIHYRNQNDCRYYIYYGVLFYQNS